MDQGQKQNLPRILIFGGGNLGIVYGMILNRANAEVVCVCRSNFELAKRQGFSVRSTILGDHLYQPAAVVQSVTEAVAQSAFPFDYIVVCTKEFLEPGQPTTASLIAPAVSKDHTGIVIMQNGIGMEQGYKDLFPFNPIISGVTYMPTARISPAEVHQTETQRLFLGIFPAQDASPEHQGRVKHLASLIAAGGASATVCSDIQVERWKKLIGNATWNPICALSRCRDLEFLQVSEIAKEVVHAAMNEVVAVSHAIGYGNEIHAEAVNVQLRRSAARTYPGVEPSMMADMRHRSRMEVRVIIGEVVTIARVHGVAVPRLETLYVLLVGLDWALRQKQNEDGES